MIFLQRYVFFMVVQNGQYDKNVRFVLKIIPFVLINQVA